MDGGGVVICWSSGLLGFTFGILLRKSGGEGVEYKWNLAKIPAKSIFHHLDELPLYPFRDDFFLQQQYIICLLGSFSSTKNGVGRESVLGLFSWVNHKSYMNIVQGGKFSKLVDDLEHRGT